MGDALPDPEPPMPRTTRTTLRAEPLEDRTTPATFTVTEAAGATAADIQAAVDSFRTQLGTLNANTAGSVGSGRREINWDGVPDALAAPNALPADFFNTTSPRGAVFSTPGTGFEVSGNAGVAPVRFDNLNVLYSTAFSTFSAQRLFTPIGSNVTDVTFFVPGSTTPASVTGFGAVFTDVDFTFSTKLEFFSANNVLLFSRGVLDSPGVDGLSFLGAVADSGTPVFRVRITTGVTALNSTPDVTQGGGSDKVALDDFVYGEPVVPAAGGTVGGIVFNDVNGDGVKQAAEPARPGVTVFVDGNGNNVFDSAEKHTTTAADGSWSLSFLADGAFRVRVDRPFGFAVTTTVPFTVNAFGGTADTLDFGVQDTTPPVVQSITRLDPDPTNAAQVRFQVTFSDPVTGFDATDAAVVVTPTTGSLVGASVAGITGGGAVYTVTLNSPTGTGAGTLGLTVLDNDSITDAAGTPLGGPAAGDGTFTAGETYTIDRAAPTVTIDQAAAQSDPTSTSPVSFTVVFSEPVFGVQAEDLLIDGVPASAVTGGDNTYTFTFSARTSGTVNITWAPSHGITDLAQPPNPFNAAAPGSTWSYQIQDITAPRADVILPVPGTLVRKLSTIEIQFDEPVTGVDATDLLINGSPATQLNALSTTDYLFTLPVLANGPVQVRWATTHGIRDLAAVPNAFQGGAWSYTLDSNAALSDIILNEFVAVNVKGLRDEDGDPSDWIEIYNAGTTSVDLFGFSLTDDPDNLAKWKFPHVTLNANSYLVVFADEKNRLVPTAPLHTNFKLEKNGEYLALVHPDRVTIATQFRPQYPAQREDISYGLDPTTRLDAVNFATPTPGAKNSTRGDGFTSDVDFSTPGGTFRTPFLLTLTTADPLARIHYTIDGTLPTTNSVRYTDPISISSKRRVRARAFAPGKIPSSARSEYYLPIASTAATATSDLPIIVIDTFGSAVPNDGDLPAFMAVFEPGPSGRTSLTNRATLTTRIAMDKRGSSTLGNAKANYNVEAWDELNADKDIELLGLPPESDFVFHAPFFFDPSLIHNPLAFEISDQMGRYAPRYRFAEVYVNTGTGTLDSSHYVGVYNILEKVKRSDKRVDIARLDAVDNKPPAVTGGYIFKIDRTDPGDSGFNAGGQAAAYFEPKEVELRTPQRAPQRDYLTQYLNTFAAALNGANYTNPATGYAAYIDTPAWIDHHIINVLTFNVDALRLSTFMHKDRSGLLVAGPIWDFDRAIGSTDGRDSNPRVWSSGGGTDFFGFGTQAWWGRLFQDPDFWQRWIDRWQDLRPNTLSVSNLNRIIDTLNSRVVESSARDFARWQQGKRGGNQAGEIAFLKNWLNQRLNFMDTNLLARPVLGRVPGEVLPGTTVTLTGPSGARIYYTTNGTDPRLPGGGVSPSALTYTTPLVIDRVLDIRARCFNAAHRNLTGSGNPQISSSWSGLTRGRYTTFRIVRPGDLSVTEIHYHPSAPSAAELVQNSAWTSGSFEFIELKNVSGQTVDLYGARFTKGINFNFATSSVVLLPSGSSVILASDAAAFQARHGTNPRPVGIFRDSLDDSGETIRMENVLDVEVFEFAYQDRWYPVTDGLGYSLVLRADSIPEKDWDTAGAWRPSANVHGSPGQNDPAAPLIPAIRINEALTHTDLPQLDAVELYNPTDASVGIGNWYLSDDRSDPKKFRIPPGTTLAPGGYRVFDESDFNLPASGDRAFRLNALGDQVWLFAADSVGTILPYSHGFDFGGSFNGVSFGRWVASTGEEQFVSEVRLTLGSANAGPKIGPLIISEVMYHPPDLIAGTNRLDDVANEFIELQNISNQSVKLFDPAYPTNTWRLRDAVDFIFPENTILPPNAFALVVSFDPATNVAALTAFKSKYSPPAGVPIFGPYQGKLDNSSDSVELVAPDEPVPAPDINQGKVARILVDRVKYSQSSPWPTNADGWGPSLQRKSTARYGNDPANWYTSSHTAGRASDLAPADTDGDGMPDSYETQYGLDPADPADAKFDTDGDGHTNYEEFIAGTDPRQASSALRFESVQLSPDGKHIELRFRALKDRIYSLHRITSLTNGTWEKVSDAPSVSQDQLLLLTDPVPTGTEQRYYRLSITVSE